MEIDLLRNPGWVHKLKGSSIIFLTRMLGMLKIFQVWISIQFLGPVCGWVWATGFSPLPQRLFRYTLHISDKNQMGRKTIDKTKSVEFASCGFM